MSAITAKASRKMKKYAVLTREPRCFLGSFDFSWEQRKLGELVDRVVRKNINNESTLPLTISAQYGLVDQITYFNNRVASRDVSNYYLVLNGEFAYNKSTSDGYPFGAVKRLDLYEKGVLSTLYIVFAPKKEQQIDSDYLTVFFDTDRWHKGVAERAAEGARNHGLLNISAEDFFDIDLSVPKDIVEQKQIGAFIRQLDDLITLHQRQHFLHSTPDISLFVRLIHPFYTSSWEQRKVSDLAEKTYGGGTPTTSNEAYWNGDIPWIQSSDVVDGKLLGVEPRKWITQDGLNNSAAQLIPGNSIAIITRVGVGKLAFMPYSYATSQDFLSLSKLNAEPLFTVYACYKKLQSELNAVQGTSIKGITKDELLAKNIMVPRYAEQQQIGAFFKQLDNLITLHQRKFEKLTNVKKSMLEKMFPQNGSSYPEIRFKGFTDPWEQRKLTEFVEFFSGLTYTPNDVQENGTLVLRSSNVSNGEVVNADNVYVNPQVVNSENVKVGDIVVVVRNGSRSLIGKHAQIKAFMPNTVIGAFMTGIRSECPEFTNALLNTSRFEEEIAMNMGATINQITGYMFSKMEFKVPCLDEQKKIGEYFEKLDNLITLHQRELEKLQNIKKSMLEKMFA